MPAMLNNCYLTVIGVHEMHKKLSTNHVLQVLHVLLLCPYTSYCGSTVLVWCIAGATANEPFFCIAQCSKTPRFQILVRTLHYF